MTNRKQFQFFPFHLVDLSPWPILTSFSVFLMAISAVMCFHGFANGGKLLLLGFILTVSVMLLWFNDVVTEGTIKWITHNYIYITKAIYKEDIIKLLDLSNLIFNIIGDQLE
jgi:Cytochrome c oxidase subunit III